MSRRSRVCFGGSLSRIESACSQLKVSHALAGSRAVKIRPNARSRSTALHAAWLVATYIPNGPCHPTGAVARQAARAVRIGDDVGVGEVEQVPHVGGVRRH